MMVFLQKDSKEVYKMSVLKVDNISYSYGRKKALDEVSFEVKDGLVGVLGANGAGKTTAMKLITTLFSLQKGDISLDEFNYKKDIKEIRKKLGYLPQGFSTYGNLTGREFLEVIAELKLGRNSGKIQISEIIESLDMQQYIDNKIKAYSGGMKQKLGFAQVLIGDPKLIVVDEPTVGLDPEQRNMIRELFPIISDGRIVMATTHIVEDIEYYCNYLLVMREGRLIYKGTKDNFVEKTRGIIWKATGDLDTFKLIKAKGEVLANVHKDEAMEIKYICREKLTSESEEIEPNLQDAYIAFQRMAQGSEING